MTGYDAATWQPETFLALDNSCDNANSHAAPHFRYAVFTDTDDDGNPVQSADASRTSSLA
jgi:hypothetical protein